MFINKKANSFIVIVLSLLFSVLNASKGSADIISSTNIDTYTINLSGSELNNISGLNLKIKIPGKKADITTGITFMGTGASVLLSTVTGPTSEEYTLSLVLTGMITDGKATITGKFIDNSIVNGAEFLVTSITRDGNSDLTSILTKEIIFSNSKATPTPTATPTSTTTPSSSPDSSPAPVSSSTPSTKADDIVDLITSEDGELDIDPSSIEENLAEDNDAKLLVSFPSTLQLKKEGLNKIYLRLQGAIDKGFINNSMLNQFSCYVFPHSADPEEIDSSPDFLKLSNPVFSIPISQNGSNFRFARRVAVNVLPDGGIGTSLLKGELGYYDVQFKGLCTVFDRDSQDGKLRDYANTLGKTVNSLTVSDLYFYFLVKNKDSDGIKFIFIDDNSSVDLTLLAPEVVTDTFAPEIVSAEIDSTGKKIIIIYNEALKSLKKQALNEVFQLKVGNSVFNTFTGSTAGNKVTLELQPTISINASDKIEIAYTGTLIKDLRGNTAVSFSGLSVNNKKDYIPPKQISATLGFKTSVLDAIDLKYDEKIDYDLLEPEPSDFFISAAAGNLTPYRVGFIGQDSIRLYFKKGQIPSGVKKLNYTPGSNPIKDLAGNSALGFTDFEVR